MSMKDYGMKVIDTLNNDFLAARTRKHEIQDAIGMLANAGVSDDVLAPLNAELEQAKDELREVMVHRMLVRSAMIRKGWLD